MRATSEHNRNPVTGKRATGKTRAELRAGGIAVVIAGLAGIATALTIDAACREALIRYRHAWQRHLAAHQESAA